MDHRISATTLEVQKWHAKDCTMSIQQLLVAETSQFFHSNKSDKGPTSSSKGTKNIRKDLIHLDGNILFPRRCIRIYLRHCGGNWATAGGQGGTGSLYHGVNSDFVKKSFQMRHFASPGNQQECFEYICRAHVFLMRTLSRLFFRLQSSCHALTSRTRVAQGSSTTWSFAYCVLPNFVTSHRAMSCVTLHLSITATPGTCTPSLTRRTSFSSDPLLGELQPCADLRQLERGSLGEPHPSQNFLCLGTKRHPNLVRARVSVARHRTGNNWGPSAWVWMNTQVTESSAVSPLEQFSHHQRESRWVWAVVQVTVCFPRVVPRSCHSCVGRVTPRCEVPRHNHTNTSQSW